MDRQDVDSTPALLRIVELFGPTLQGEGPSVGSAAHFLRLADCNLTCEWCDTAFSWDRRRRDPGRLPTDVTAESVLAALDERTRDPSAPAPSVTRLVITGGEPLLQARVLTSVCRTLATHGWVIEVETSGTVAPGPLAAPVDRFTVSPKLAHSGVAEQARLRPAVLAEFAANESAVFKFVAQTLADMAEIDALLERVKPHISSNRVWVMAEGTTSDLVLERSRLLADAVVARGWGLTPRWHTLLWGDERGR